MLRRYFYRTLITLACLFVGGIARAQVPGTFVPHPGTVTYIGPKESYNLPVPPNYSGGLFYSSGGDDFQASPYYHGTTSDGYPVWIDDSGNSISICLGEGDLVVVDPDGNIFVFGYTNPGAYDQPDDSIKGAP